MLIQKQLQQINFTGNLNRGEDLNNNTTCFSLLKKQKRLFYIFHKELRGYCSFIFF